MAVCICISIAISCTQQTALYDLLYFTRFVRVYIYVMAMFKNLFAALPIQRTSFVVYETGKEPLTVDGRPCLIWQRIVIDTTQHSVAQRACICVAAIAHSVVFKPTAEYIISASFLLCVKDIARARLLICCLYINLNIEKSAIEVISSSRNMLLSFPSAATHCAHSQPAQIAHEWYLAQPQNVIHLSSNRLVSCFPTISILQFCHFHMYLQCKLIELIQFAATAFR